MGSLPSPFETAPISECFRTTAVVRPNPLAIGIPSSSRSFVFDMATSVIPMGKVLAYLARGETLEAGWAVDAEGRQTTDPEAARWGSIAPVDGAKGYGLGVSIGILAGLLSGGEVGKAVRGSLDTEYRCTKGDLFILIDPMAFPGGPGLAEAAGRYLDELRSSRPQEGFERVAVPGDRSRAMREERLKNGISHPEDIWYAAQRVRASI
jgi:LDH2 family malate/lactate/ureidoglycolate dehydrogenase